MISSRSGVAEDRETKRRGSVPGVTAEVPGELGGTQGPQTQSSPEHTEKVWLLDFALGTFFSYGNICCVLSAELPEPPAPAGDGLPVGEALGGMG